MPITFRRLLGLPPEASPLRMADWLWALGPWAAPLLILLAPFKSDPLLPAPRPEFLWAALAWMVLLPPGLLAANALFPAGHPLGRGVSRLSAATVLALVPFALPVWAGYLLHWRLTTALLVYALLYLASCGLLGWRLLRRPLPAEPAATRKTADAPGWPPWLGAALVVLIGVMLAAVAMASAPEDAKLRYNRAERAGWWIPTVYGAAASFVAAGLLVWASRRPRTIIDEPIVAKEKSARGRGARGRAERPSASAAVTWPDWIGKTLAGVLWFVAALLVGHVMRVTYADWAPGKEKGPVLTWNVDDVAYVPEALDYRYGYRMGVYEPSLGSEHGFGRGSMSVLTAPLVAAISRFTGISCAALHHSVLPPLMVLLGASGLAAVLMVVFHQHRWLVPLGMIVAWLVINKSWDYERCFTEMSIMRALQSKGVHLLLVYPLQLAGALLVLTRPGPRHATFAVLVGLVGYLVHPFAAIQGVVWSGTLLVAALLWWRPAGLSMAAVLGAYVAFCGSFYVENRVSRVNPPPSSGRVAGTPIQSPDLVRIDTPLFKLPAELRSELDSSTPSPALRQAFAANDVNLPLQAVLRPDDDEWTLVGRGAAYRLREEEDGIGVYQVAAKPILRIDPFLAFGMDTLNHAGCLAVPLLLGFGWRRREWLAIGLLGAVTLVVVNFEPVGHLLNIALPESIFWRAKWMTPALVNLAGLAAVLFLALDALLRPGDSRRALSPPWAFGLTLPVIAAFLVMVASTTSIRLRADEPPQMLSKFDPDIHGLVDVLGGIEASPFVFGTFFVHHELPQLMPHVKLVFSREKIMRTADDPNYRAIAKAAQNGIRQGRLEPPVFDALCRLYPIDHVVIDRIRRNVRVGNETRVIDLGEQPAAVLRERGWTPIGRSGIYEVWRKPGAASGGTAP